VSVLFRFPTAWRNFHQMATTRWQHCSLGGSSEDHRRYNVDTRCQTPSQFMFWN